MAIILLINAFICLSVCAFCFDVFHPTSLYSWIFKISCAIGFMSLLVLWTFLKPPNFVIATPGEDATWNAYFNRVMECPECRARNWNAEHTYETWELECQSCWKEFVVTIGYNSPRTLKLTIEKGPVVGPEKGKEK